MIKLPSYEWFMGNIVFGKAGNRYSGSFGCDPLKGNIAEKTFRYSVWLDKDEEGKMFLKAVHYVGPNALDSTDESIITEKRFDASSEGILDAQKWIKDAADAFYNN